jgi:hypothetical protein
MNKVAPSAAWTMSWVMVLLGRADIAAGPGVDVNRQNVVDGRADKSSAAQSKDGEPEQRSGSRRGDVQGLGNQGTKGRSRMSVAPWCAPEQIEGGSPIGDQACLVDGVF